MSLWDQPSSAGRRSVLLTLALIALVMRVMIPAGFMMGQAPSGAFAMVICSPAGSHTVSVDWADADGREKAPVQKHDAPCVFAGHGLADAPPDPLTPPAAATFEVAAAPRAPSRQVAPGRGLAAPPPPPTGPPVLSI